MKKIFLLISLSICCLSCSEDAINGFNLDGQNGQNDATFQENFGQPKKANFIGKIVNSEGEKLIDVQVTIGGILTATDHNGVFVINDVPVFEKFAFINVIKDGYLNGSRTIVPTANSTNDIQITLLKKNRIEIVNSGEESSVTLGASKVIFSGDFVDSNNNPYIGQVEVSMHYLEPNKEDTFTEMPGMLFGQASDNDAVVLETYGMLAINLFSPGGEPLNITQTNPATIEFPVDTQQMAIAPDIINLWYFDDNVGYWKEEGTATKVGNIYRAEVSHFSWWNVDLPSNFVNVCFVLQTENGNLSNNYLEIVRNETGQIIYTGFTNEIGEECGLFRVNEEITIRIFGPDECDFDIIFEENLGFLSNDTTININVPLPNIEETTITAILNNCEGEPISNGYALILNNNNEQFNFDRLVSITDGVLNYNLTYCNPLNYSMIVFNLDSGENSSVIPLNLLAGTTNLSNLSTCNTTGGTFEGAVILTTQEEINLFGLLGYIKVNNIQIGYSDDGGTIAVPETDISDLSPLSSLVEVVSIFIGSNNQILQSLKGLENLAIIEFGLWIQGSDGLTSLSELEGLTHLKSLIIADNASLQSLDGFHNLLEVEDILIGEVEAVFNSKPNPMLVDFCAIDNLIVNGIFDRIQIEGNGYNPTVQNFIDGNCAQ